MIQCGSPAFTAATWLDANGIRGSLDDVSKADLFVGNESR
jgi:hypothetical protein